MNVVNQVITAVEASSKVVWSVFIACGAIILVDINYSESFQGLPLWIMPATRLVCIFTFVTSLASILPTFIRYITYIFKFLIKPLRQRNTKRKLLKVDSAEVALLCKAIVERERILKLKPDSDVTLSMQDQGIIARMPIVNFLDDGTQKFQIPIDVWRVILSMDEFRIADSNQLIKVLSNCHKSSYSIVLAALPQNHPTVISELNYIANNPSRDF